MTLEPVLVLLLATSFTCVGLLSLWAAWSPRHWFPRAAVFLAVLSPLLLIPAYEPFVAFALQGIVVVCGAAARRWWHRRRQKSEAAPAQSMPANLRFSLSTLLLLMALIALATPIVMQLPRLTWRGWTSVALIGATSGLVTLLAGWMFRSQRKLIAWPTALVLCVSIGVALSQLEWFAAAVVNRSDWPPQPPPPPRIVARNPPQPPVIVWPITLPTTAVLLTLVLLLYWTAIDRGRNFSRVAVAAFIVLIAAFPLGIVWKLLHPHPIPEQQLPEPNSYDVFIAAGQAFNSSPILNTTVQAASTAQLAGEVAKYASTFDQVHDALTVPCYVVLDPIQPYKPFDFSFRNVQTIRSVARALNCKAELAQQQQRFHDAALISFENMRVGVATARGGIVPHYLVSIAVEVIGMGAMYKVAHSLEASSCDEVIRSLEEIDGSREPVDAVIERDRVYCENGWGWYGHFLLMLDDLADSHPGYQATKHATLRSSALRRLMTLELALRQYLLENGALPERLDLLVPNYISRVPIDPFDANKRPLQYIRNGDSYVLYSVGFDGDDDVGRPATRDTGWMGDGDLRLNFYFENW
jgi:hypothetical protein